MTGYRETMREWATDGDNFVIADVTSESIGIRDALVLSGSGAVDELRNVINALEDAIEFYESTRED